MNLINRLKSLEVKNSELKNYRYFDCDGKPQDCTIMLVGINPANGLPNGKQFWDFWTDEKGFNLSQWKEEYGAERKINKKSELSHTRLRIEILRDLLSEYKLLNCNIYSKNTKREKDLNKEDRDTELFKIILDEVKPEFIILYGKLTKKVFKRLIPAYSSKLPDWEVSCVSNDNHQFKIISVPHLFNMAINPDKNPNRNLQIIVNKIASGI